MGDRLRSGAAWNSIPRSGVREDERKSKGAKQVRVGVLHEQGQPGNHVMLKRQHVNGVCGPRRVRGDAVRIEGEGGLPVGCRWYHAKAGPTLPSRCKEGPNGLAPRKPLSPQKLVVRPRGTYSAPPD